MEFSVFNGRMAAMTDAVNEMAAEDIFSNENDFQLAAELSKSLLQRVKELEQTVTYLQQTKEEQETEIDLLKKQIEILRGLNDSRMRMYEEIDKGLIEAEHLNEKLKQENKVYTDRIKTLSATVARLDKYSRKLEEKNVMSSSREVKNTGLAAVKRTTSLPCDMNRLPIVAMTPRRKPPPRLKQTFAPVSNSHSPRDDALINSLRIKLEIEKKRRVDAEKEVEHVTEENVALQQRLQIADNAHTGEPSNSDTNSANTKDNLLTGSSYEIICHKCKSSLTNASRSIEAKETENGVPLSPDDDDVEYDDHDEVVMPTSRREVVRLKNGGSAFGSRESLNLLGLETDDGQVGSENCETILAADAIRLSAAAVASFKFATDEDDNRLELADDDHLTSQDNEVSLLGGLEEQYRRIVAKYERLVEIKTARQHEHKAEVSSRSRPVSMVLETNPLMNLSAEPKDPMQGHFETGPPEYKKLFNEIFETLRRSTAVVMEDEQICINAAVND